MDFNKIFEDNTSNEILENNSKLSILKDKPFYNLNSTNSTNSVISNNVLNSNINYFKNDKDNINFSGFNLNLYDNNILNNKNIKHNTLLKNTNNVSKTLFNNYKVKEITLKQFNQLLTNTNNNINNNNILLFDCRTLKEYKENKNILNDIIYKCNININKHNTNNTNNYINYKCNIIWFNNIQDNITLIKNTKDKHIIFYINDNNKSLEIKNIIINLQKGFNKDIKKYCDAHEVQIL